MESLEQVAREALSNRRAVLRASARPLSAEEHHEVGEIDAALTKIARGAYGRCESCNGAIGRQRLRAIPEARRCLRCD